MDTELKSKIIKYVQDELKKGNVEGGTFTFVDGNEKVATEVYGNVTDEDAPFIIGSMSKSFTALAIMQLEQAGLIELGNPVGDYIPELHTMERMDGVITVADLLHHVSGFPTNTLPRTMQKIYSKPGKFQYANQNYNLLGKIIEVVSGMPYAQYIQENIFEPLQMNGSTADLDKAVQDERLQGYLSAWGINFKARTLDIDKTSWIQPASGYITSTANDMATYLSSQLTNTPALLSDENMERLHHEGEVFVSPSIANMFPKSKTKYAMGWIETNLDGVPVLFHSGSVSNFMSVMVLVPSENFGFALLLNTSDTLLSSRQQLAGGVASIVLGKEPARLGKNSYMIKRTVISLVLILILLMGVATIFVSFNHMLMFVCYHMLLPSILLLIPTAIGMSTRTIKDFAPDVFMTYFPSIALMVLSGAFHFIQSF